MSEFQYKKYTREEDEIYDEAIAYLQSYIDKGMKFDEACALITVKDPELKRLIADDFLKIMMAQLHYSGGMPVKEVAEKLGVPIAKMIAIRDLMVEEISHTAMAQYHRSISRGEA